jgi:hypothetical protein
MTPLLNLEGVVVMPFGVGGNWAFTALGNAAKEIATTASNAIDKGFERSKGVNFRVHVRA